MKLKEIIEKKKQQAIEAHMPSKSGPVVATNTSGVEAFQAAFDEAWVNSRDTSRSVEADGFHASSLGVKYGTCPRRNVYLLRGIAKENRFDARTLRVFQNGHDVHARIQRIIEQMGVGMESEVRIDHDDPPIKGHADGVLVWEGRKILLEIKSCSDDVFINRLKFKKPKEEHFAQANIYAWVLGIDTIFIVYENKNTQEVKFFEVPANKEAAEKIVESWRLQYKVFKDGELPKRPYKPGSPTCAGCDLKTHCMADPEVGVDLKEYAREIEREEVDA